MAAESNRIQWRRTAAEGAAIVISILLAFAIDAWWEERQDRQEEQRILLGLQLEFAAIEQQLSNHREQLLHDLDSLRMLFDVIEGRAEVTSAIIDNALLDLMRPLTSDIANGTLHALLGSGQLELLSDRDLRQNLVDWESVMGEVWDDQHAHAKMIFEIHVPYFVDNGFLAAGTMEDWFPNDWQAETTRLSEDAVAVERLLGDASFHSLVQFRYGYRIHLVEEFDSALAAVRTILEQVGESIH